MEPLDIFRRTHRNKGTSHKSGTLIISTEHHGQYYMALGGRLMQYQNLIEVICGKK